MKKGNLKKTLVVSIFLVLLVIFCYINKINISVSLPILKILFQFILDNIRSILLAILIFIVGLIFLPDKISFWILKKIKPDLISKKQFMEKIYKIFDVLFNNKEIIVEQSDSNYTKELVVKMHRLVQEKRLLEGNLFFLDFLRNLTRMLFFSFSQAGYQIESLCNILDRSTEYLLYYAKQLKQTSTLQGQRESIDIAAESFRQRVEDTLSFLQNERSDDFVKTVKMNLQYDVNRFDSFMEAQYNTVKVQLKNINQQLVNEFLRYIEG